MGVTLNVHLRAVVRGKHILQARFAEMLSYVGTARTLLRAVTDFSPFVLWKVPIEL